MWDRAFERAGHQVTRIPQELTHRHPHSVMSDILTLHPDVVFYSRTHDSTALTPNNWTSNWRYLESEGIKTAALHADLFWGLEAERESLIKDGDPLFTMGTVFTADGGHQEEFAKYGVNHVWCPPCIDIENAHEGVWKEEYACDVVFVGSGGYHPAYPERPALIQAAHEKWGERFKHFGNDGIAVVRGQELCDVIASAKVVLGDSCFALNPDKVVDYYWSDRIPETLGRGGVMAHARTLGLEAFSSSPYLGMNTMFQTPNDVDSIINYTHELVGLSLYSDQKIGMQVVRKHHTFDARAKEVLDALGLG